MRAILAALLFGGILYASPRVVIKLDASTGSAPRDGRLILIVSKDLKNEPRTQVTWGLQTQQIFGIDADTWKPGSTIELTANAHGDPLRSSTDLPPGTYNIQAVLNVYQTFHRADGRVLKLHPDHGEGQQWNESPGNLYSKPQQVKISDSSAIEVNLTETIPPIDSPKDTKYVRHLRIQSKLLTKFWGEPVFLEAKVLVPAGFDSGNQRYPVAFLQSHFDGAPFSFLDTPPDAKSSRQARTAYQFYQDWTSGRLPRMLLVVTVHPTPFYDDSYGVNTANAGPYGDALTQELYPAVEKQFRAIGASWARVVFGGSTGGWMTLAQQIFYPDYFGGAWGFCPDPVDFHAFPTSMRTKTPSTTKAPSSASPSLAADSPTTISSSPWNPSAARKLCSVPAAVPAVRWTLSMRPSAPQMPMAIPLNCGTRIAALLIPKWLNTGLTTTT